ncbi:ribonuclease HI-like protein [Trifolium pratense]|uniref:Ribonuclease HI-like protein n=1 Tax=Trifolium pratense TaxID=57577 RepID=A0A2K3JTK5_TRIPR|nr:ribonuclease HI-like protein [Trifolium pratense]
MTSPSSTTSEADKWTIFIDGASSATGAGAGIILENENGIIIEVSLALSFRTSNNQAEYEAFLAGLRLAEDMEAKEIKIYTDSQLVASQVLGKYQAKNDNLSEYLALVKEKITKFEFVEVQHVPREHNKRADILSKLASTKKERREQIRHSRNTPSTKHRKVGQRPRHKRHWRQKLLDDPRLQLPREWNSSGRPEGSNNR